MIPTIRTDKEVMEQLNKEGIRLGMIFPTPNEVLRRILGLDSKVQNDVIEVEVQPSYKKYEYIGIRKKYQHLFPAFGTEVESISDNGAAFHWKVYNNGGSMQLWDLDGWFVNHPELKTGDKLRIEAIEPGKRYKLSVASNGV